MPLDILCTMDLNSYVLGNYYWNNQDTYYPGKNTYVTQLECGGPGWRYDYIRDGWLYTHDPVLLTDKNNSYRAPRQDIGLVPVQALGGNDAMSGSIYDNLFDGGDGKDKLFGYQGNDILIGGKGADHLDGGLDMDTVQYKTSVTLNLRQPQLSTGDAAGDKLVSIERINLSPEDDVFVAGLDNPAVFGDAGDDDITGASIAQGGLGADVFRNSSTIMYAWWGESSTEHGRDTIVNFDPYKNHIDLRYFDAVMPPAPKAHGKQVFRFVGSNSFSGTAGELRFENGELAGDVDGDAAADFSLLITGSVANIENYIYPIAK